MLKKINDLKFLEDITEEFRIETMPKLFKDGFRVFRVKNCPEITFRISSDWEGNWMAGKWYFNSKKIENPEKLFNLLSKVDAVELAFNLDTLQEISSWKGDRFVGFNLGLHYLPTITTSTLKRELNHEEDS